MDSVGTGPTWVTGASSEHAEPIGKASGLTVIHHPERPGPAGPEKRARRFLLGRWRLVLEGLAAFLVGLALTFAFIPALRDRSQAVYYDVLIHALGPDHRGVASLLRHGVLPTWLPTQYGGEPYLANLQHGILYPGNALFWLLPTSTALDLTVAAHIAWAVLGMWAFCRFVLGVGMWGAAAGALAFGFGGVPLQHVILTNQLQGMSWMPWVLLAAYLALERGRLRWTVLTAVTIGLQFLCGHPEGWIYTMGALVLFGAAWVLAVPGALPRRLLRAASQLGGALVLFALLFAWQLLPTLQLKAQGYRDAAGFSQQFPLPKAIAVNVLLPDYGHVLIGEYVGFVGVVALGLFALGVVAQRQDLVWARAWLVVVAALGFVMALGNATALYRFFYEHAPLVSSFRVPARYLVLTAFALSAGAALGADELLHRWVDRPGARALQGAAAVGVLLAGGAVAFWLGNLTDDGASTARWVVAAVAGLVLWLVAGVRWLPRAPLALLLLGVMGLELLQARPGAEYHQKGPNAIYDSSSAVLGAIAAGGGRYLSVAGPPTPEQGKEIPVPPGLTGRPRDYYVAGVLEQLAARPDSHLAVLAETPLGRDGGLMPLARYLDFWRAATGAGGDLGGGRVFAPPSRWRWPAVDFLAVRWFVTSDQLPAAERRVLERHGFRPAAHDAFVLLWERPAPPLARLLTDVRVARSATQQVATLGGGLDLTRQAVVERPVRVDAGVAGGSAEVLRRGNTDVVVRTTSAGRSLLVLADPYYPGWLATVDGKPASIVPTDRAFRGVEVAAGTHTVRFHYANPRLRYGLLLTALTVLALLCAGPVMALRRRRGARVS